MKIKKFSLLVIFVARMIFATGCTKKGSDTSSLYSPTSADATATATLQELQQGRSLYIDNCGSCHGLYNPDSYTPSQWRNIISNMSRNTGLSSSEVQLVTKYVTRGN